MWQGVQWIQVAFIGSGYEILWKRRRNFPFYRAVSNTDQLSDYQPTEKYPAPWT